MLASVCLPPCFLFSLLMSFSLLHGLVCSRPSCQSIPCLEMHIRNRWERSLHRADLPVRRVILTRTSSIYAVVCTHVPGLVEMSGHDILVDDHSNPGVRLRHSSPAQTHTLQNIYAKFCPRHCLYNATDENGAHSCTAAVHALRHLSAVIMRFVHTCHDASHTRDVCFWK